MKEFETFSEAFRQAVDNTGQKHSTFYEKIGMDKGWWSKIYSGEVKNPQAPTRDKLTDVVGVKIKKVGKKWRLVEPSRAQSEPEASLEAPGKDINDFLDLIHKAYSISEKLKSGNIQPESREEAIHALEFVESLLRSAKEAMKKAD